MNATAVAAVEKLRLLPRYETPVMGLAYFPTIYPTCAAAGCDKPVIPGQGVGRFHSAACKSSSWRETVKRRALVDALMDVYQVHECERQRLTDAVTQHPTKFDDVADRLGLRWIARDCVWLIGANLVARDLQAPRDLGVAWNAKRRVKHPTKTVCRVNGG